MNSSTFYFNLDVHDTRTQASVNIFQNDTARSLSVTLFEDGKPYAITSDCVAVLKAVKPDETVIYNACTLYTDGVVTTPITAQMVAATGIVLCQFDIYGGDGQVLASPRFSMFVENELLSDSVVISSDEYSELAEKILEVQAIIDAGPAVSIVSVEKTSTSGLTDTYTITFSDDSTTTYQIVNGAEGATGNGISSISKISTVGLVDTYQISMTNGTSFVYTVTNGAKGDKGDTGVSITSIDKVGDAGLVDTYQISFSNGEYSFFTVTNGAKGDTGAQGPQGIQGVQGYPGVSITSVTVHSVIGLDVTYDIAFNNGSHEYFTVSNGETGPQGPQGVKGDTGSQGPRGTSIGTGTTLPESGMLEGDLFILTPAYELYRYGVSSWQDIGAISVTVDTTLSTTGKAADAKSTGDALATKADKDGYYDDLSVGRADNLISNIELTDEVPYSFRTAGGALEISDPIREKAIVGLTSVWNQRCSLESGSAGEGWKRSNGSYVSLYLNSSTRTYTLSSDTNESHYKYVKSYNSWLTDKHIYLVAADVEVSDSSTTGYCRLATDANESTAAVTMFSVNGPTTGFVHKEAIKKATYSGGAVTKFQMALNGLAPKDSYAKFRDVQVFDLTRIFGKDVAEYLLARETASAGAGVDIFRSFFPNKYYAKDTGTWMFTKLSKKISVGFNAYNASTHKALVIGNHEYRIEGSYTSYTYTPFNGVAETILASDASASERSFPFSGVLEITGADSDLCVHLKWDGERDGEKEEYKAREYVLDDVELKGFWDIDEGGNISAFGDTYYPDGTITRKVSSTLIGSLTWTYDSTLQAFYTDEPAMKTGGHIWCLGTYDRYKGDLSEMPNRSYWNDGADGVVPHTIIIKNTSYTTVSDFTTALGQYPIYYELDDPSVESADPFTESQRVDNWGTEQYVDYAVEHNTRDVSMPYGHITEYPQDLKAKVEVMPDAPETDGLYLLKRENGINYYTPFGNGLPDLPEDGAAYTLMCDASGTTPTVSWESPMVITIEDDGEGGYTVNRTMQEINEAYAKGRRLVASYYGMRAELTFANIDFYTFMFVAEGWLFQGNIYYNDTTLVEIKRSVILDATGLDDYERTPWVVVNPDTQESNVTWERASYTYSVYWDSVEQEFVSPTNFGEFSNAIGTHPRVFLYAVDQNGEGHEALLAGYFDEYPNIIVYVFEEYTGEGVRIWAVDNRNGDDSPGAVTPPSQYLASVPFVITLTQSGMSFTIDMTIAEITEAYQQNRPIWLQGVVTMDGSTFFNFKSQLNGVVSRGNGLDWYPPYYTFVVEYDTGGSGVYHMVVSCYINADDEDAVRVTPILLS